MIWFGALWHLVGLFADVGPGVLLAGTAVVAGAWLAALLAIRAGSRAAAVTAPPAVTRRVLRERAGRIGVPRHRDPDAAGRRRPRAPAPATHAVA